MKMVYNPDMQTWNEMLIRPKFDLALMEDLVNRIFTEVKTTGDSVVKKYTGYFDHAVVDILKVPNEEIDRAENRVSEKLRIAIRTAARNIRKFHTAQQVTFSKIEIAPGVMCWQSPAPIEKVGLYIPGGTAPLFSTALMLAIPAQIAGCREVVLCTPPAPDGSINPVILYTAKIAGVTQVFRVGGIQAIAAMTFGTETIPAVYKIFGPGNQYVTAAKMEASRHGVAIDLPAGPSEVMVVADETANPVFIAADLLSQAEHGKDSQVMLVTWDKAIIAQVEREIELQIKTLQRKEIIRSALENSSLVFVNNKEEAVHCINSYAPEHLILSVADEAYFSKRIINAGSVFIGNYTPESAGDYASGTNHTLPTAGFARIYGGVSLDSFLKKISYQKISREGLEKLAPVITIMAAEEKLEAHKNAVEIRINNQ
ncbi:MAG: histidinol dehydrogenase [Bacteroidales bacterium]|nr:histidinol dehydrogenase [Bacteroidales bacterium]